MQSKRVKARISYNKTKRQIPGWKREMRAFFISQLPPAQAMLSSKHFAVETMKSGEKVLTQEYQNQRASEIFAKMTNWTRHDWNAFIRSGDADYSRYIAYRSLYNSMVASRLAAKQLMITPAAILETQRMDRIKLIKGMIQEQINECYRGTAPGWIMIDGKRYVVNAHVLKRAIEDAKSINPKKQGE